MIPEEMPPTVMVVDDFPFNLNYLQKILSEQGYTVMAFPRGELALAAVAARVPDVILLDIVMPGLDGFEVCRRLKADARLEPVPVLFISALDEPRDKLQGFAVGGVDYITRPFDDQEVLQRVRTHLRLYRLSQHLENMVAQRTAQLEQANAALQEEIAIRRQTEEQLKRQQAMLQTVFDGITDPLILVDQDLRIKLFNQKAAAYCARAGLNLAAGQQPCLERAQDLSVHCNDCPVPQAMANGAPFTLERENAASDARLEQVVMYPVIENDTPTGEAIIRITDITDERRLSQEMAQHDKLVALGTLVAGIGHEINNPNQVILLNLPVIQEVWQDAQPMLEAWANTHGDFTLARLPYSQLRSSFLQTITDVGASAARIDRLLTVLKNYSRKSNQLDLASVNIRDVLSNTILLLNHKIQKTTEAFQFKPADHLPLIQADAPKLEQVFVNLIANALEALPHSKAAVRVEIRHNANAGQIEVLVNDEGCGIPAVNLSRIIDPFFTTKSAEGGTGLGLAIAQQYVTLHKGHLEISSREGVGSRFRVVLPVVSG